VKEKFPLSKVPVHIEISRRWTFESHFEVIASLWNPSGVVEDGSDWPL
jgi:hypothetical protein